MSVCRCQNCPYLWASKKPSNSRTAYSCKHPDRKYIEEYFKRNGMVKMPGFLGYGHGQLPLRRTVRWCPLEKKG